MVSSATLLTSALVSYNLYQQHMICVQYISFCPGVYISETSHKSMRNFLGVFQSLFLTMGMLSSYTCGYVTDWRTLAKIMSVVSLCASFAMIFVPETPYWLFEKGKNDNGRYVRSLFSAWLFFNCTQWQQVGAPPVPSSVFRGSI
jgi:hypothetical protein